MVFSTIQRMYDRLRPTSALNCRRSLWRRTLRELRRRGEGRRESGGFLLGRIENGRRYIKDFIAYDDVDPKALRGIIVFDASKMDLVWSRCTASGLQVVADVHTHPAGYGQSATDRAHPMIPQRGHLALIVPDFAGRLYVPGEIGIYEFLGRGAWRDHSASGPTFFRLGWL